MNRAALILLLLVAPAAALAQAPQPDLFLSANGGNNPAFAGWPLVLHLTVMNSTRLAAAGPPASLTVAPATGSWTGAVGFSVVSSTTGQTVPWPLKLAGIPGAPALTLGPTSYVRADWQLSAGDVSSLPPGDYVVTATMQVSGSSGWNGIAQSAPLAITIAPEPGTLTADQQFQKALLQTEFALNVGDVDTAISVAQQIRLAQPDNPLAGAAAANVLEKAGYPTLAFMEANQALDTFYRVNPAATEAPSNLLAMYQRLLGAMSTPGIAAQTSLSVSGATIVFSSTDQLIPLSALITTTGRTVQGGTVTFTINGLGTITSGTVAGGNASAIFTVPGGTQAGNYAIQGAYSGAGAFAASMSNVNGTLAIQKATPLITWANPADISQGTALGASQLNATASVPGTFVYAPPAGTLLSVGPSQTLSAAFTPTDATDYNGASASVSINVTQAALIPLTITATSASRQYGLANPAFTVGYTGFVNGDTPASLSGSLNCLTTAAQSSPVNVYPITCSGLSSQKYSITFVPGSLSVTAAPLTITANSASRPFGQANPAFGASFSGFVNSDTPASLSGTLSCASAATPSSSVGGSPYQITCSGVSSPNYTITFAPGLLTVTKATPSITWVNPADIAQGTALGASQLNATANVPGTFVYTPPAGTLLSAGAGQTLGVAFTPTDSTDYNGASASVTINVVPAALIPLTITANNASRQYGQANPAFTVSYSGFVNGDGPGSLAGTLSCVTTATQSSPVNVYPMTCSGLSSQKYAITFVPGSLSVTVAPLTITANNASRPFGQANPAFGASFSGFVNSDTPASLAGALSCASPATPSSPVSGSPYPVNCSGVTSANYSITFLPGLLMITKATAVITWANPADITQGTALGATQLNATANVPGSFTYLPPAGTLLSAGLGQALSVTFLPADGADYNSASASVTINVNPRAPVPGDLNGDGVVDCADLNIIKAAFGKKTGQAGFDPRADLNKDGIVNVIDLSAEARLVPAGTACK